MTALFREAEATSAFLKMGLLGFAGSGKTYTATMTAIGLVHYARQFGAAYADKPAFMLDTEVGSDWILPRFKEAGIKLYTAKTRAFSDLIPAVREAEANASVMIIDSISAFWREFCESYMKTKKRTRLQFEDWTYLKGEWGKFTDAFLNSSLHLIIAGRAGYEYDYNTDEETGKKNLEKTGIKMKAENEMGYEPSLLVLMEREMDMATTTVRHTARVLKDRSTLLDGRDFYNPSFESFLPHIECLNLCGKQLGVDVSRNSEGMIPTDIRDNRRVHRDIVLDEIESLLVVHYPGQTAAEKKAKVALLRQHWNASWTEMEKLMPLEALRRGYDALYRELEGKPSRYGVQDQLPKVSEVDELPGDLGPPKPNGGEGSGVQYVTWAGG